jgi:hypothetical protein
VKKSEITALIYLVIAGVVISCLFVFGAAFLAVGFLWVIYELIFQIYEYFYYRGKRFLAIKESVNDNTAKCNDLNQHIEELKRTYSNIKRTDYGQAEYIDNSNYSYKRPKLEKIKYSKNVYECSASVCKNAQAQPFKYICKYFDIKLSGQILIEFEKILNNFSAAEQGKLLLSNERNQIIEDLKGKIPLLIMNLRKKKLIKKLGFDDVDFNELYFPIFSFSYVSPGGNSSLCTNITLNIENLDKFVRYLSDLVKFKKSVAGQRALMTTALRKKIKIRDHYTCQECDLSTEDEPNLLLEIDHVIPLSKNGITSEENLQTLCWRCNRTKGSKIIENNEIQHQTVA